MLGGSGDSSRTHAYKSLGGEPASNGESGGLRWLECLGFGCLGLRSARPNVHARPQEQHPRRMPLQHAAEESSGTWRRERAHSNEAPEHAAQASSAVWQRGGEDGRASVSIHQHTSADEVGGAERGGRGERGGRAARGEGERGSGHSARDPRAWARAEEPEALGVGVWGGCHALGGGAGASRDAGASSLRGGCHALGRSREKEKSQATRVTEGRPGFLVL